MSQAVTHFKPYPCTRIVYSMHCTGVYNHFTARSFYRPLWAVENHFVSGPDHALQLPLGHFRQQDKALEGVMQDVSPDGVFEVPVQAGDIPNWYACFDAGCDLVLVVPLHSGSPRLAPLLLAHTDICEDERLPVDDNILLENYSIVIISKPERPRPLATTELIEALARATLA